MNKFIKLMAGALLVSFKVAAANAQRGPDAQIQEIDARFRKAMIQGDADELQRIVANDAKIIHGYHGGIQSKEELINEFRSYHIEKYDRTPIYSKVNGNSAVLISVTHKFLHGEQIDTTTTEVLVRRSGRWQILVLQNTDHAAS
jgi:hypothetical protein